MSSSQTENPTARQSPCGPKPSGDGSPIANQKSPLPKRSTGPRTPQGRERSSQNARKHGLFENAGFSWDAALALGEDPCDFQRLLKGLVQARWPADALEMALVEDIALLSWKNGHLDRAELAVQVRNLQKHDLQRRKQFAQVGREISNALQSEVREKGLRTHLDAPGKFEQVLSILDILVEMVEKNDFSPDMQEFLRALYGAEPTLRGAGLFNSYFRLSGMKPDDREFEDAKTLIRARLAEEISDVAQEYELFLREHVENTRAARIAATAPSHAQWAAIIRQQNALHRQLERKIRLLQEVQGKRKEDEARFLDNYQSSLRRNPSGGPHSARKRRGQARPEALAPSAPSADGLAKTPDAVNRLPQRREGWRHPAKSGKKIINRGNELRDLLQLKGLGEITPSKRTPFCAQNVAIGAKKRAFHRKRRYAFNSNTHVAPGNRGKARGGIRHSCCQGGGTEPAD